MLYCVVLVLACVVLYIIAIRMVFMLTVIALPTLYCILYYFSFVLSCAAMHDIAVFYIGMYCIVFVLCVLLCWYLFVLS